MGLNITKTWNDSHIVYRLERNPCCNHCLNFLQELNPTYYILAPCCCILPMTITYLFFRMFSCIYVNLKFNLI